MAVNSEILTRLPHRPPFLWIDEIREKSQNAISTAKVFSADLEIFTGHYPGNPLVPGVILCEAIFQTGALLMSYLAEAGLFHTPQSGFPVITRIGAAKFKRMVRPDDEVIFHVQHIETLSNVAILKGSAKVQGKTAVSIEFNCTFTA